MAEAEVAPGAPASERAYRWTLARVLDGTFDAGAMISEGEVSTALGVSRTPVREAFLRLAAEGTLRLFPKRGALVVPVTQAEMRDVLEARLLVEPWAVAVAARLPRRGALVDELARHLEALRASHRGGDAAGYQDADRAFHEAIVATTGNDLLVAFYRSLRDRQLRMGATALTLDAERAETIVVEHAAIAGAIGGGRPDEAADLVRAHLETTRQALAIHLRPS